MSFQETKSTDLAKELGVKSTEIVQELGKIRRIEYKKGTTNIRLSDDEVEKLRLVFAKKQASAKKTAVSDAKAKAKPKTDKKEAPKAKAKPAAAAAKTKAAKEPAAVKKISVKKSAAESAPAAKAAETKKAEPAKTKVEPKVVRKPEARPEPKTEPKTEKKPEQKPDEAKPVQKIIVPPAPSGPDIIVPADIKEEDFNAAPPVAEVISGEDEVAVPDRFKKEIEVDKVEKIKASKAFQSIKRVEPKKWIDQKGGGKRFRDKRNAQASVVVSPQITVPRKKSIKLEEGTTIKIFAETIGQKISDVIKKFMELGYMPTVNQPVDLDAAVLIADAFGVKVEVVTPEQMDVVAEVEDDEALVVHRPPVVTVMGHVDHGKTSLLDAIRETKVIETEAGGITQHIGAYKKIINGKVIAFLDTPGHEAFTALRARGAKVTDIVILVVAADDGVMPQTIEAINHAKAANVPIIVAVNKIDKPEANPTRVKNELSEHGIISEDWGGSNIFVEVSAKQRTGIEHLLEMVLLQAEIMELKANPSKASRGTIIEAKLDKGRGPVATVLIQSGTLKTGDAFVAGTTSGRVRALIDDTGKKINDAGPSMPVEVIGFSEVPSAGDSFTGVEDEKKARQVALARLHKQRLADMSRQRKLTLDEVYAKIKEGQIKELNIIIKGDVQGSVEALKKSLEDITHAEVKVRVIHTSVGGITESDVMLATASNAIIIGFNVRPESKASSLAEKEGVDIRLYNIIYVAIEDVKKALEGMLEPTLKERVLGRAEVRMTYQVSRIGTIAGSYVIDGYVSRASEGIRVIRDNIVVYEGRLGSLKRFKEDVKEVQTGYECGITIENFNDLKVGDVIENYIIEKIAAKL
ncbi:MAG: translation initiation factor IF-2 [Dissulfurispiraceae bacterium]|jgi:translation initiation factor IF-2|nr:translation initiation factor IF-2 [Dissulfurispiraceae bacterium]